MRRWLDPWLNPIVLFILGFLLLSILEQVGLLPHLVVVILACSGALALVLWLREQPSSLTVAKVKRLLDDEILWAMEAEHHSSMAHDGETELHNREVDALRRLRDRIEKEEKKKSGK